jgi:hypothetical protein
VLLIAGATSLRGVLQLLIGQYCIDRFYRKEYYDIAIAVLFLSCWYKESKAVRFVVSISKIQLANPIRRCSSVIILT